MWLFCSAIFYSLFFVNCLPHGATDTLTMNQAINYFEKYNYMGEDMPDPRISELSLTNITMAVEMATRLFQHKYRNYGLRETGVLDVATMKLMSLPRCGVMDIVSMDDMAKRKKRYLLKGDKWYKSELTYKILVYPRDGDLTRSQVDREIARALIVWQNVTPLTFKRLERTDKRVADINIEFSVSYGDHGDGNPFDGPGGTLAHAYYPGQGEISGDSHFDEAETWTINSYRGTNLFQVAAHEFGHALGLGHSEVKSALMAPFYSGYIPNFKLPYDDIQGIQAKYGPPKKPPVTPNRPAKVICSTKSFDGITIIKANNGQKKTYGFKGRYYFLIDSEGIVKSYPRLINSGFRGLPNNIDAALYWDEEYKLKWDRKTRKRVRTLVKKAATFIFKGAQYWKVEDMKVLPGYPKPISDWDIPSSIDAAFVRKRDGHTYFIKGSKYYTYIEGVGIRGNAKPLSNWRGIPSNIDAAFQWTNGKTYIFKGSKYYKYNDYKNQINKGYPRNNEAWLGCARITG